MGGMTLLFFRAFKLCRIMPNYMKRTRRKGTTDTVIILDIKRKIFRKTNELAF